MSKCDITMGKTMTVNTGNFSSVKPSVSMTLHDIEVESVGDKSSILSEILDNMLTIEIIKLTELDGDIKTEGVDRFTEIIRNRKDDIEKDTRQLQEKL